MNKSTTLSSITRFLSILILISGLWIIPQVQGLASTDNPSEAQIKQQTRDLLASLKAYSVDQRDEALQKTKSALDSLDKRINQLESKITGNWDKMDQAAREMSRLGLKALREQRTQVAEWYGSLKSSSAGAWNQMKIGIFCVLSTTRSLGKSRR